MFAHRYEDTINITTPGWRLNLHFITLFITFFLYLRSKSTLITQCIFLALFKENSLNISLLIDYRPNLFQSCHSYLCSFDYPFKDGLLYGEISFKKLLFSFIPFNELRNTLSCLLDLSIFHHFDYLWRHFALNSDILYRSWMDVL